MGSTACPSCGAANEAGRKFCGECGASLRAPDACPACATAYSGAEKFCGECGTRRPGSGTPEPVPGPAVVAGPTELRQVSVLFVDLVGFTAMSEVQDPEDVRSLLSQYFETARVIVGRYGGTVEKFIGDAVMAVWGSPIAREDDAERAVRAALDVVAAVPVLGEKVGVPTLSARAGVVTGQAASVDNPSEGLVVGDRVNTAARVQSAAAPGAVLVDDVTRGATHAAIAFTDAGEHVVKGKAEPLHLWQAMRVVAGVRGAARVDGLEAGFVGHETELSLVKALLHDTVDRRSARMVTVSGQAGVGKTRLAWEFEKYTDGLVDALLWHHGRCLSYGDGVAYWALAQMIRDRLGIADEDPSDVVALKVADGLARYVDDPAERDFL
ncbi:MAG: adenylate/guanylate cyclase domain-containing protein, partial [Gaiellales bacterium]